MRSTAKKLQLEIRARARLGKACVPLVRKYLPRAHELIGRPAALRGLSVALVGDRAMSALHRRYLGIAGPTDVLSFSLGDGEGEIIIDVEEARRRARERGADARLEALLYAIHGMLHLCGYDDRTKTGFAAMHRMEDKLLKKMGLGPVFAFGSAEGRR